MFKPGDIVKYSPKYCGPGEEYYIHEVKEVNPDTDRILISTLNTSLTLGSSSRVSSEMIKPAEKYEIIVTHDNADHQKKFVITDTENRKVFAGYDFMGSIDWTESCANAYQMDIDEAEAILTDFYNAEC